VRLNDTAVQGDSSRVSNNLGAYCYAPSVPEKVVRDGANAVKVSEKTLKVLGWLGKFWQGAATVAEVAGPFSKFLGRAVPVLAVPVAAFDIYRAVQVWNDPKASLEDKITKTTAAGLSTIAAGAGIAALAFPPAAPILLIVAGVAGVGALIAEHWDTVKNWAGKAWDGVKEAGEWVADKAVAAGKAVVDGAKAVGGAIASGAKAAWNGVKSLFSGW
jgi:hypothetical protein